MKILKNKNAAIIFSVFFMLSMTASIMLLPNAHAASNIKVYAYINASPNPTGVGQQTEIIMWVNVVFGNNAMLTNDYRFTNYQLIITAPDGTNTTQTFAIVSDPTSAQPYFFTPKTTGTYTLTFNFPQTNITASNDPTSALIGYTYLAATASTTLTVQENTVGAIPQTPFPTSYWTRPIYGENTDWYTLGSNWLGFGSPGYIALGGGPNLGGNGEQFGSTTNVGSLTSHIMWTMPLAPGGIVGQTATTIPGNSYAEGSAYDQKFQNPIIVDGILIFTKPVSQTLPMSGPTVAVDLQTGQTLWTSTTTGTPNNPVPPISFAYVYDAEDPNQHGVWPPMLVASVSGPQFSTQWNFYDAYTGNALFNVSNIPGQGFFGPAANVATALGPEGEYIMLLLTNYGTPTNPNWYLQQWNSSRIWDNLYSGPSTTPDIPPPISQGMTAVTATGVPTGKTVDATWTGGYIMYQGAPTFVASMYDFNVSVPWLNNATLNGAPIGSITVSAALQGDMLLAYAGSFPSTGQNLFFGEVSSAPYTWYGINLNTTVGSLGAQLWSNTLQAPSGNITVLWAGIDPVNDVFVENYRETMQFVGFSLATGKQIWGPTVGQAPLDYYGSDGSGSLSDAIAYGNIYSSAYAGILYCYSAATGDLLWTFGNGPPGSNNSTDSGVETPFGHYPTFINAIGSGVVYTVTTEHTEETPIFKGALARAINATTGEQIWTLSAYTGEFLTSSYAIADGFSVLFNGYDNQVYVVGRGPSRTTVTAGPQVTHLGDNVVISGRVTDISTGTKQTQQAGDFPNGVPVAADASMTDWMGYIYQQQPKPTNHIGVPVTISVTDSNHNTYVIGTATTDESGMYSLTWTPTITGNFTVYAAFQGTNSYWPSSDENSFNVMNAPTPAPTATSPTGFASDTTVVSGIIAIAIIIIVIGAILGFLIIRKRP